MPPQLQRFTIIGLHNSVTIDVPISDNRLIVVGDNGAYKTTLITILYHFIAGSWMRLADFVFDRLIVEVDGEALELTMTDLLAHLYDELRLHDRYAMHRVRHGVDPSALRRIAGRSRATAKTIRRIVDSERPRTESDAGEKCRTLRQTLPKQLGSTILYLPTYRRIEQEIHYLLPGDPDEIQERAAIDRSARWRMDSISLIRFGMADVDQELKDTLTRLKDRFRTQLAALTTSYLREIIDGAYAHADLHKIEAVSEETISAVIDRMSQDVLHSDQRNKLLAVVSEIKSRGNTRAGSQLLAHYFLKLLDLHESQSSFETNIQQFVSSCNQYLHEKQFDYDASAFRITLRQALPADPDSDLKLQDLSSGEKQIVSLFSRLLLSESGPFYVLIDEPELSLSVEWQRRFLLDISNAPTCTGLIAVTHSPFVFDNQLDKYARSIGEFRRSWDGPA